MTAETDLTHLSEVCLDNVQATLDEVLVEVAELEAAGDMTPDARVICTEEPEDLPEDGAVSGVGGEAPVDLSDKAVDIAAERTLTAEEAITTLRAKIDRLGPVNILAIEQFDELETRHTFLTTQRCDLTDSIAQTTQAIKRIDETTRARFSEAFAAINRNFRKPSARSSAAAARS